MPSEEPTPHDENSSSVIETKNIQEEEEVSPPSSLGAYEKSRWCALITLILLAACFAEFLTGSTPILEAITHPIGFAQLVGLYGGGALLIREAAFGWRKRWGAVLLLGCAYAVGEEGFGAKTMIDPTGSVLRDQLHSHWLGINWVPLAGLTIFHAVVSITIPILLVEQLFPKTKGRRLLSNRGVVPALAAYALAVITLSAAEPYQPTPYVYAFLAVYSAAFIAAAYFVPASFMATKSEMPDRSELNFLLLGSGFMAAWYAVLYVGANVGPWPLAVVSFVALAAITGFYLRKHAGSVNNERVKIAFVFGIILVFIPIDVNAELSGDTGVLLFTALIVVTLVWLRRRISKWSAVARVNS